MKDRPRWLVVLQAMVLILAAVHVVFFANAVIQRFRYPVELEWMSGGVLDHVERVTKGEPVYVAPSAAFIPFLYPPLYYWLSALVAKVATLQAACRIVSVIATIVTGIQVFRAARKLGATTYWALASVGLFVSAYTISGYWYDLERSDLTMMALVTSSLVVLLGTPSAARDLVAGALIGLAFFAKQPSTFFLIAVVGGLALARQYGRAARVGIGGLAILVPLAAYLTTTTNGWFWFYVVKMPSSHGIDPKLFTQFFVVDLSRGFAFASAAIFVIVGLARNAWGSLRHRSAVDANEMIFGAMMFAGFVASATSRLHVGGFINVLIFWTTFGAIAFGVVGTRLAKETTTAGVVVVLGILQMLALLYDPGEAAPDQRRLDDQKLVAARVGELEKKGDVIVWGRSHLTATRHFHAIALMDILRAGQPIPRDLLDGLENRRYAAFVIDEFGELGMEGILGRRSELSDIVVRNYFVAQELDDRERPPLVGWIAHPSWVMRPRTIPIRGTSAELDRRLLIERGVAEMRMRAVQSGARKVDDGDEVEQLAAAIDQKP